MLLLWQSEGRDGGVRVPELELNAIVVAIWVWLDVD
jgi:hypothetical protein